MKKLLVLCLVLFCLGFLGCAGNPSYLVDFTQPSVVTDKVTDKNDVSKYTIERNDSSSGEQLLFTRKFKATYSFAELGDTIVMKDNQLIVTKKEKK